MEDERIEGEKKKGRGDVNESSPADNRQRITDHWALITDY